jgi:acetyltransferase-like isoleucine patch superfamily enzyme
MFLNSRELKKINFKYIGRNVKISNRSSIYNPEFIVVGDNSRVDDFCLISGMVKVGNNVHIAAFCNIAGGVKGVILEDFVGLSYGCTIFSQSDDYSGKTLTNPTIPDLFKNVKRKSVIIKKHSIIGTNSCVFPGVIIEEGCSFGANSTIKHSTKPWGIYAGVPLKRIKNRSRELLELEKKFLNNFNI